MYCRGSMRATLGVAEPLRASFFKFPSRSSTPDSTTLPVTSKFTGAPSGVLGKILINFGPFRAQESLKELGSQKPQRVCRAPMENVAP